MIEIGLETANMAIAAGVAANIIGENVKASAVFAGSAFLIHKIAVEIIKTFNSDTEKKLPYPLYNQTAVTLFLGSAFLAHKLTELFFKRIALNSVLKIGGTIATVVILTAKGLQ